jgi:hypothetical protein
MLAELRALSASDGSRCLPRLIEGCMADPALLSLHVWMTDQAIFGTGRIAALRRIERAATWCETEVNPAKADMGWLLDGRTGGARFAAWCLAVGLDLGFELASPSPWPAFRASSY